MKIRSQPVPMFPGDPRATVRDWRRLRPVRIRRRAGKTLAQCHAEAIQKKKAEVDAIRAAEPQPKPNGQSSSTIRRNPYFKPSGAHKGGAGWMITMSSNAAYINLRSNLDALRAEGIADDQLRAELERRHGPAVCLANFIWVVSPLRDKRLKAIMDAKHLSFSRRETAVFFALWRTACEEADHCFDFWLPYVHRHADPPKGVIGWTGWGGPDVAGMRLDYRPLKQPEMF